MPVRAAPKWIVRSAWVLHATLLELIANVRSAGLVARK
jgi:hypothetical protein